MTAMKLHRYPSVSGGVALGKIGAGVKLARKLPYDAEVEYLASTGTQWIDTGVAPVDDVTFVVCAAFTDLNTGRFGVVQLVGTGDTTYRYYFGVSNGKWIGAINSTNYNHNISQADTGIHIFKTNSLGLYIDDVMMVAAENSKPTIPVYLANIDGSSSAIPTKAKLYSCKIYDANGVLVRDYIPVRKGMVGYLYDRVSGKLFGNAGTGDFVLGPDVVPVEYLESDGNAYINTGVMPADDIGARATFTVSSLGTHIDNYVLGSRAVGAARFYLYNNEGSTFIKYGWGSMITTSSPVVLNQKITASLNYCNDRKFVFNASEVQSALPTADFSANVYPMFLFGANFAGQQISSAVLHGSIYDCEITKGATPVRSFRSVRVGSGTTWEGAMIDTLTRRIYRNAGTGAFAYGNDLKYPIPAE